MSKATKALSCYTARGETRTYTSRVRGSTKPLANKLPCPCKDRFARRNRGKLPFWQRHASQANIENYIMQLFGRSYLRPMQAMMSVRTSVCVCVSAHSSHLQNHRSRVNVAAEVLMKTMHGSGDILSGWPSVPWATTQTHAPIIRLPIFSGLGCRNKLVNKYHVPINSPTRTFARHSLVSRPLNSPTRTFVRLARVSCAAPFSILPTQPLPGASGTKGTRNRCKSEPRTARVPNNS